MGLEPVVFDSTDISEAEAALEAMYSKLRIMAVGESTRTRITRRVLSPELGFDDLEYSFEGGYSGAALPHLIICEVVSNSVRRIGEGNDETFGPGEPFAIALPGVPYDGVAHSTRMRFSVLDPILLDRVAVNADDHGNRSVRVLDHRTVSPQAARQLQRAVAHVRSNVLAVPEAAGAPLVVAAAAQYLAASVLQAFPNTAVEHKTTAAKSRRDAIPVTARRAIAFIEANPDVDITLADIARAARVTPRALQLAFRRHLDTSPMEYLQRVRVDLAHRDLQGARPGDGVTVTGVSYRWGFSNPSRFARYYRAVYGTNPSVTLARSRNGP